MKTATELAQQIADQELEACCEEMKNIPSPLGIPFGEMASNALRNARRSKPPSLKEQALKALKHAPGPDYPNPITLLTTDEHALIRQALEQLDD